MPLLFYKYLFIVIGVLYFLLPFDLDMIGPLGRIDDLLLAYLLWSKYKQMKAEDRRKSPTTDGTMTKVEGVSENSSPDPYALLGLQQGASPAEITRAYERVAKQYQPEKLTHLSEVHKKDAERKRRQLKEAFQQLQEHNTSSST